VREEEREKGKGSDISKKIITSIASRRKKTSGSYGSKKHLCKQLKYAITKPLEGSKFFKKFLFPDGIHLSSDILSNNIKAPSDHVGIRPSSFNVAS